MRNLIHMIALFGACFFTDNVSATTIVPFANLGEATVTSEVVVLAHALSRVETIENGDIYQYTRFEVMENVKGGLAVGAQFLLRPMSHRSGDYDVDIAGDFSALPDKTYLLFLYKKGDVWMPMMLSYYVFEQFTIGSEQFLAPVNEQGIEVVNIPGQALPEPLAVYKSSELLQNLAKYVHDSSNWDGSPGRTQLLPQDLLPADRAVPVGCDFMLGNSANLARWQNAAIPIYYDDTAIPPNWNNTFSNILSAMNSNYTGIEPSDAGPASYTPNCTGGAGGGNFTSFCDNNLGGPQCALIIFDDPCNEIAPLSGCSGVLAFGGSYASSNTHIYDGMSWQNARYGYVVVNQGATCLSQSGYEQLLTHELTHAYRMDHLNATTYPNQNMNASCCNPIGTKDRECMNYAYSIVLPVELATFDVRLLSDNQVKINWTTQSEKDNAFFSIRRSADGYQFEDLAELPSHEVSTGGSYEWTDKTPLTGLNYYMLSQTDLDGRQAHLGIKAVTIASGETTISITPNPISDQTLRFRIDLPEAFEGTMAVLDPNGSVISAQNMTLGRGSSWVELPIQTAAPGIYVLRVYNTREEWSKRFTKK